MKYDIGFMGLHIVTYFCFHGSSHTIGTLCINMPCVHGVLVGAAARHYLLFTVPINMLLNTFFRPSPFHSANNKHKLVKSPRRSVSKRVFFSFYSVYDAEILFSRPTSGVVCRKCSDPLAVLERKVAFKRISKSDKRIYCAQRAAIVFYVLCSSTL